MNVRFTLVLLVSLFLASVVRGEEIDPEQFLQPPRATNFTEQRLLEMIRTHRHGDLADAASIQRKLAQYYAEKGNKEAALLCEQRAKAAGQALKFATGKPAGNGATLEVNRRDQPATPPAGNLHRGAAAQPSDWSGRYYGMIDGVLHKWDFNRDGTFSHQIIASGRGTSVRNQEKGTFSLTGTMVELTIEKQVSAYATPGLETHGRQTDLLGGGAEKKREIRHMKIKFIGPNGEKGINLDGKPLKVRSWN